MIEFIKETKNKTKKESLDDLIRAIFLADLHIGSIWALANPSKITKNQGTPAQEKLYEFYCGGVEKYKNPDVLVLNGDSLDGQGKKDSGIHQWSTDPYQQIEHCIELIAMWGAKKIYVIGGSGYHRDFAGSGLSMEEMLARELNAEIYPNQEHLPDRLKKRSGPHWFLTFFNTTAHFAHHISVSKVFSYMSTPIAREMMQARLNDPMRHKFDLLYSDPKNFKNKESEFFANELSKFKTKLIVRAHAHYYWECKTGGSMGIILPAWQIGSPFIWDRNSLGYSQIGYLAVDFYQNGYRIKENIKHIEEVFLPPHTIVG